MEQLEEVRAEIIDGRSSFGNAKPSLVSSNIYVKANYGIYSLWALADALDSQLEKAVILIFPRRSGHFLLTWKQQASPLASPLVTNRSFRITYLLRLTGDVVFAIPGSRSETSNTSVQEALREFLGDLDQACPAVLQSLVCYHVSICAQVTRSLLDTALKTLQKFGDRAAVTECLK
ncbi:hypothetical protein BYT27DRAFT_7261515 [Phlegmacium glaucopus]|nr:hypothetical protein BYT27DRAFT_7261515 [Phlegmacium glaucopus]